MFVITKSTAINSIDLAGFKNTFAYIIFLSTKSGVVVDSSKITLKSDNPNLVFTLSKNGTTRFVNRAHVA